MPRVRTLEQAAAFIDRVGIALVFGKADVVLPSLWDEVCGPGGDWAVRDENGKATAFTPEFDRLWHWKDDLPERRLVCAGRHLARDAAALISRKLVPAVYALTGRAGTPEDFRDLELTPLEREVTEAVLAAAPISAPELRRLLATDDKKGIDKAVKRLQRELVLTNAGVTEQEAGWPAVRQDVFARRWRARLKRLPSEDDARRTLARTVLAAADEVSEADLAGALGWTKRDAAAALEELEARRVATARQEEGFRIWSPA
jgi:chromosome segregation and condensation protein ScpB